jgi:hypothetical protein
VIVGVLGNDVAGDEAIDPASVVVTVQPLHGSIDGINPGTGAITYTHDGSSAILDSLQYTVDDTLGATSNAATATIRVPQLVPSLLQPWRILLVAMLIAGTASWSLHRRRLAPARRD